MSTVSFRCTCTDVHGHDHGFDRDHVDLDDHPQEPELPRAVLELFPPVFAPLWVIWKDADVGGARAGRCAGRHGGRAGGT